MVKEARELIYGPARCPEWGTKFAEIESDAKEAGHEFIRLLMEQTGDQQSQEMPETALKSESGEVAQLTGTEQRTLETESGPVGWPEPKAHLPKSRKAFFPSELRKIDPVSHRQRDVVFVVDPASHQRDRRLRNNFFDEDDAATPFVTSPSAHIESQVDFAEMPVKRNWESQQLRIQKSKSDKTDVDSAFPKIQLGPQGD